MTKLVLPPLGRHAVYHTNPECPNLNNSDNEPVEPSAETIEWHSFEECPRCKRGIDTGATETRPDRALQPEHRDPGPLDPDALQDARIQSRLIAMDMADGPDPFEGVENSGGYRRNDA